jgi:hypothetical protein
MRNCCQRYGRQVFFSYFSRTCLDLRMDVGSYISRTRYQHGTSVTTDLSLCSFGLGWVFSPLFEKGLLLPLEKDEREETRTKQGFSFSLCAKCSRVDCSLGYIFFHALLPFCRVFLVHLSFPVPRPSLARVLLSLFLQDGTDFDEIVEKNVPQGDLRS